MTELKIKKILKENGLNPKDFRITKALVIEYKHAGLPFNHGLSGDQVIARREKAEEVINTLAKLFVGDKLPYGLSIRL